MNSRDKGKRGERAWAAYLKEQGFEARRGIQFQGGPESPDVVCDALKGFHFEVKNTENLLIKKALEQANGDAPEGAAPVVAWKQNHVPWRVILDADVFFHILQVAIGSGLNPADRQYTHGIRNDDCGTGDCDCLNPNGGSTGV